MLTAKGLQAVLYSRLSQQSEALDLSIGDKEQLLPDVNNFIEQDTAGSDV